MINKLPSELSVDYIKTRVTELSPWYHKINLGNGIVTPGRDYERLWDSTRTVIDNIDYNDKRVLDLASWDGYWAFEAERRGAKQVVSSDVRLEGFENLLFARQVLGSKVIPMCNAPVQDLPNRLDIIGLDPIFDIVHHFGLLYHLRDPLLSLTKTRAVMPVGGLLVLETAFIDDDRNSFMAFAGLDGKYHFYGVTDTWAPSKLCLREILKRSMFEPVMEDAWISFVSGEINSEMRFKLGRITMIAKAVAEESVQQKIWGRSSA